MSNVRDFGAAGDGQRDDSQAIRHAVQQGDGLLQFPRGVYRLKQTVEIDLDRHGPLGIDGSGGTAKIVMDAPGPAFRLIGTHGGTGNPNSAKDNVWASQRLPTIRNIEIEGGHEKADGIAMQKTMQSIFEGVLVRQVRHGIHLLERNRNVLISHCHVYDNTGVGIFLDGVNLHQINIADSHISYNRLGGIRIEGSEVRNLQITGNDIEYNNHRQHGTEPEPTAEIYVDTTAEGSSVAEITIASNTIQATPSPDGANIRIIGSDRPRRHPPGLWTISGNVIGNQENNVHLRGCEAVSITGNFIYSCKNRNVLVENSRQILLGSNSFRRHTPSLGTGLRFVDSSDCTVTGCNIQDESEEGQNSGASLLELLRCRRLNITGSQFLDGVPFGIDAEECSHLNITGCTIMETREQKRSRGAVRFRGKGSAHLLSANTIGHMREEALQIDEAADVKLADNLVDV